MSSTYLATNGAFVTMCVDGITYMKVQVMARNPNHSYGNAVGSVFWYKLMPLGWDICAEPELIDRLNREFVRLIEDVQIKLFEQAKRGYGNDQISG